MYDAANWKTVSHNLGSTLDRHRPHFAHALWVLVLLKAVTPPLIVSETSMFRWLQQNVDACSKQCLSKFNKNGMLGVRFTANQMMYKRNELLMDAYQSTLWLKILNMHLYFSIHP